MIFIFSFLKIKKILLTLQLHICSSVHRSIMMWLEQSYFCQVKVKVHTLDVAPLRSETPPQKSSGMARVLRGFQFYLHSHTFIRNGKEPYLSLPSQPQLVFIYRSRRDGRLSRPSCEVVQAEIRTCNLPIANPALYHTATSAPYGRIQKKSEGSSLT